MADTTNTTNSTNPFSNWGSAMGIGGLLGGALGNMFGGYSGPDPSSYYGQIPGQITKYMQPYLSAGAGALGPLQQQLGQLTQNPGQMLNQIGGQYHQSPGFNFALNQALRGANQASAAGGMAGSPMAQQQNMGIATQLGNQDYYNWLNQATGLYSQGLGGLQNMAGMGAGVAQGASEDIAQSLAQQAQAAQIAQMQQAQQSGGMGGLLGALAGLGMHFANL